MFYVMVKCLTYWRKCFTYSMSCIYRNVFTGPVHLVPYGTMLDLTLVDYSLTVVFTLSTTVCLKYLRVMLEYVKILQISHKTRSGHAELQKWTDTCCYLCHPSASDQRLRLHHQCHSHCPFLPWKPLQATQCRTTCFLYWSSVLHKVFYV